MGEEPINGAMEGSTKENMWRIKNKDLEFIFGVMEDVTKAFGKTESSAEREDTFCQMEPKRWDSGIRVEEYNGWKVKKKLI